MVGVSKTSRNDWTALLHHTFEGTVPVLHCNPLPVTLFTALARKYSSVSDSCCQSRIHGLIWYDGLY